MARGLTLALWLLLVVTATATARAEDWDEEDSWPMESDSRAQEKGLDAAVSSVRRHREGRVLSADTIEEDGRSVHRIRILNDEGLVRGLRFDGTTGHRLRRSGRSYRSHRER